MSIDLCLVVSTLVSFSIFLLAKVVFFQIQAKDKAPRANARGIFKFFGERNPPKHYPTSLKLRGVSAMSHSFPIKSGSSAKADKSVYQIYRIFVISWAFGLVLGYFFLTYLISRLSISSSQVILLITLLFAVLASLLIAVYIVGIFLTVYASLHLEMLYKVAGFGQKGVYHSYPGLQQINAKKPVRMVYTDSYSSIRSIVTQDLFKLCNKNSIINKRLHRLVDCGELTFSGGKYRRTKSRSPLLVLEKIGIIITKLFP